MSSTRLRWLVPNEKPVLSPERTSTWRQKGFHKLFTKVRWCCDGDRHSYFLVFIIHSQRFEPCTANYICQNPDVRVSTVGLSPALFAFLSYSDPESKP